MIQPLRCLALLEHQVLRVPECLLSCILTCDSMVQLLACWICTCRPLVTSVWASSSHRGFDEVHNRHHADGSSSAFLCSICARNSHKPGSRRANSSRAPERLTSCAWRPRVLCS